MREFKEIFKQFETLTRIHRQNTIHKEEIIVTGKVKEIIELFDDINVCIFEDITNEKIICLFDTELKKMLLKINKNDTVKIQGLFTLGHEWWQIDNCKLLI